MPNLTLNDATIATELPPETVGGLLAAISNEYGPKRVKTPNMEVEQFDPSTIQRLREREAVQMPTLGSLTFSIGIPSPCGYSNRLINSQERYRTLPEHPHRNE